MIRINEGSFIAIHNDFMIEVHAETKEQAFKKAKAYFEFLEKRDLQDAEIVVCRIPAIIGYLD